MNPFSMRATYTAHLILRDLITSMIFGEYRYEARNYVVFSILVLPHPSWDHKSSSAPYYLTP